MRARWFAARRLRVVYYGQPSRGHSWAHSTLLAWAATMDWMMQ